MGLIEDFIARYSKEYDFYEQVGRLAAQKLEAELQAAGVRSIVTHRAKSIPRLADKCRQREQRHGAYHSIDQIFDDMVDLAGVRVALYFPAERDQVDGKRSAAAPMPRRQGTMSCLLCARPRETMAEKAPPPNLPRLRSAP